jgi:hypothetical protein
VELAVKQNNMSLFKGRQFTAGIILWAVRWYLQFPISYRDLERMLADRGVQVDHTTLFRWVLAFAPELDTRIRPHLRMTNGSWRVDETYFRVKRQWVYPYRAVDGSGRRRLSALAQTRCRGRMTLLSKGTEAASYGQSANHHDRQECRLSNRSESQEAGWRTLAVRPTSAGEI